MFGYEYPPRGWLRADGSLVPIGLYQTLFNLIGTQFGGDGTTNFALPDLRGQVPVKQGAVHFFIAVQGLWPARD